MKALSIKQPWAGLICSGIKPIENRTWKCPEKYIGTRVLIHASLTPTVGKWDALNNDQFIVKSESCLKDKCFQELPLGAIIGSVEIVGCVVNHPSIWAVKTKSTQSFRVKDIGTEIKVKPIYNWVLANHILFDKPIENVKGKLSFWDFPGINEVKIECPECGSIELAIEDYTTAPFSTYLHTCKCGHVIMESEWLVINP